MAKAQVTLNAIIEAAIMAPADNTKYRITPVPR